MGQGPAHVAFRMVFVNFTRELPLGGPLETLWEALWAHEGELLLQAHASTAAGKLGGSGGGAGAALQDAANLRAFCAAALLEAHKEALMKCGSVGHVIQLVNHLPPPACGPAGLARRARALFELCEEKQGRARKAGGAQKQHGQELSIKQEQGVDTEHVACGCWGPRAVRASGQQLQAGQG